MSNPTTKLLPAQNYEPIMRELEGTPMSNPTTEDLTNAMAFAGAEKMWLKMRELGLINGTPPDGFPSVTRWCAYVGRLAWHEELARQGGNQQ